MFRAKAVLAERVWRSHECIAPNGFLVQFFGSNVFAKGEFGRLGNRAQRGAHIVIPSR